jgi:hypothetical protein
MQALAIQHLSDDDLAAVHDVVEQGKQPAQYTERESEAVKTLTNAFELEVRKAGYVTVREFMWRPPANHDARASLSRRQCISKLRSPSLRRLRRS